MRLRAFHGLSRSRRRQRRGAVLLDVVLALAILALGAMVLMPLPRATIGPTELRAEAVRAAAALRKGRTAAISGRRAVDIAVDTRTGAMTVGGLTVNEVARGVTIGWVTSDLCPVKGGVRALRYLPDGRSCGAVLTLASGAARAEVRVDWLTGRADLSLP